MTASPSKLTKPTKPAATPASACWIGVVSSDHVATAVAGAFVQSSGGAFAYYSPRESYPDGAPVQAFTAIGRVATAIVQVRMSDDFSPSFPRLLSRHPRLHRNRRSRLRPLRMRTRAGVPSSAVLTARAEVKWKSMHRRRPLPASLLPRRPLRTFSFLPIVLTAAPTHRRAILCMIVAAVCWSSGGFPVRQLSITDAWEIVFWRSLFMAAFVAGVLLVIRGVRRMARPRGRRGAPRALNAAGLAAAL